MRFNLQKSKLLPVLVSLCLAIAYTPMTAFAFAADDQPTTPPSADATPSEGEPSDKPPADTVATAISCSDVEVYCGLSASIPYAIEPAGASTDITVTSSNPGVAAVSGSTITGVSVGSATLTVADAKSGLSASATVTVKGADSIYYPGFSMVSGGSIAIYPSTSPSGVKTDYSFRSSSSLVSVSSAGVVTAKGAGTANITVSDKISGKSITVPVKIVSLSSAKLTVAPLEVLVGKMKTLSYTASPADLLIDPVYSSSDAKVATVSPGGIVSGVAAGTADITVSDRKTGLKSSAKVTVVQGLNSLKAEDMTVYRGSPAVMNLAMEPANGARYELSYSSSNTSVATVDEAGLITGLALGTATITATDKVSGLAARASITVKDPDLSIAGESEVPLVISDTCVLELVSSAHNPAVTWESSDSSVATVSSAGVVTGAGEGVATITAKAVYGTAAVSWTVNVSKPVINAVGSTSASMKAGATRTFKVASLAGNPVVEWKTSSRGVASVDSSGRVTAGKLGTATITATATGGNSVKFSVKVTSCKLGMEAGKKVALSTVVGNVPSSGKGWTSKKSSVAYVSKGKVVPVDRGKTVLTKSVKGTRYTINITCIKRGNISAKDLSLCLGDNKRVTLSEARAERWLSSNADVAKVSSKGNITGCRKGVSTITCSDTNGFTYKVKVRVVNPKVSMKVVSTKETLGAYRALKVKVTNNSGKAVKLNKPRVIFYEKAGAEQPMSLVAYRDAGSYWGSLGDHPLTVKAGSHAYIYLVSATGYVKGIEASNLISVGFKRASKNLACEFQCKTGAIKSAAIS